MPPNLYEAVTSAPGTLYLACSVGGGAHCRAGQRVEIEVLPRPCTHSNGARDRRRWKTPHLARSERAPRVLSSERASRAIPRISRDLAGTVYPSGATAPDWADPCRTCSCHDGEWRCCRTRPAAHTIARGTRRYAETLALISAWHHLKRLGAPGMPEAPRDPTLTLLWPHGSPPSMPCALRVCGSLSCGAAGSSYADNDMTRLLMTHGLWFYYIHRASWFLPWHRQYVSWEPPAMPCGTPAQLTCLVWQVPARARGAPLRRLAAGKRPSTSPPFPTFPWVVLALYGN